ncbi:MAG: phosphatidylserine decarboxylase family protein [Desulfobacterales bacterium]
MDDYAWSDKPGATAFSIARAGYPFIFASAFVTGVLALLQLTVLAILALMVTVFVCFFFRDPDRVIPTRQGAVVSPADGKVIRIERLDETPYYPTSCIKISIFMSIFNVHVNRICESGMITKTDYHPGTFFNASLDKASEKNERNAVYVKTDEGRDICIIQIAGMIARRIISHAQEGDHFRRGQRFGLICFGSRLDIYLPSDLDVNATIGENVKAGVSIMGYLS